MRKVGVEVVGMGALKLTGFLRELMQQKNMHFNSLYTVRSLKEVPTLPFALQALRFIHFPLVNGKSLVRSLIE